MVQFFVEMVVYHAVSLQNLEHLSNGVLVMGSGVVNYGVKLVDQVHVGDLLVDVALIECSFEVTF